MLSNESNNLKAVFKILIQGHDSASSQIALESWEEEPKVSKYASSLEQLAPTRNIPMDPKEVSDMQAGSIVG